MKQLIMTIVSAFIGATYISLTNIELDLRVLGLIMIMYFCGRITTFITMDEK